MLDRRIELAWKSDDEAVEESCSDEDLDFVVARLRRIARSANLEFALRVGALIIHHFYGGTTAAWRWRGAKNASFRRLARHPDLPMSPVALYRCVALFEMCERLKAPSRWEHLGASHLRIVIGLAPEVQERVLAMANERRWTVKALQEATAREKSAQLTRGGRRADSPICKKLKTLKKCLSDSHVWRGDAAQLSERELEESLRLLEEARRRVDDLSRSLRRSLPCPPAGLAAQRPAAAVNDA